MSLCIPSWVENTLLYLTFHRSPNQDWGIIVNQVFQFDIEIYL